MIHELSKFLTDYQSWQYVVTALGLVIIGGGLTAWKAYFLPLLLMGEIMLFALLNNQVTVDNLQGIAGGMASTMPIIFAAGSLIGNFRILENATGFSKRKDKPDEEKPADIVKPPEITNAFDKEQFNKRQ